MGVLGYEASPCLHLPPFWLLLWVPLIWSSTSSQGGCTMTCAHWLASGAQRSTSIRPGHVLRQKEAWQSHSNALEEWLDIGMGCHPSGHICTVTCGSRCKESRDCCNPDRELDAAEVCPPGQQSAFCSHCHWNFWSVWVQDFCHSWRSWEDKSMLRPGSHVCCSSCSRESRWQCSRTIWRQCWALHPHKQCIYLTSLKFYLVHIFSQELRIIITVSTWSAAKSISCSCALQGSNIPTTVSIVLRMAMH